MPLRSDVLVPPEHALPPLEGLAVHVLGIRGRGMTPVALAAAAIGAHVDGCDFAPPAPGPLEAVGIEIAPEHDGAHADGRHVVVTTMAPPDLAEVAAARDGGRLHHRTDLLAAVVRGRHTIAVTGTHGKGTVAAITGCALAKLGADPLLLLGVNVGSLGGSFRWGHGTAVMEADDADGTIARLPADVSVVTNSWFDHPMLERSRLEVLDDVCKHVARVPETGRVVLGRGRNLSPVKRAARAPVWQLGRDFDVSTSTVDDTGRSLRLTDPVTSEEVEAHVRIHGGEITDNAALAYAALRASGHEPAAAAAALDALDVLERRLQLVGTGGGVRVFDDYGKHPDATAASLAAARELRPRQLHAVYEPNLHADVLRFGRRWANALGRADTSIVLPVDMRTRLVPKRKAPNDWPTRVGIDADLPATRDEALELLVARARPGDVIVISGVHPDIAGFARRVLAALDREPT